MTATDTTRPNPDAAGSIEAARRDRRRRTIYASLAGWTLLGAASVGLVACSSAGQSAGTTSAAATTSAATSTKLGRDLRRDLRRRQQRGDVRRLDHRSRDHRSH